MPASSPSSMFLPLCVRRICCSANTSQAKTQFLRSTFSPKRETELTQSYIYSVIGVILIHSHLCAVIAARAHPECAVACIESERKRKRGPARQIWGRRIVFGRLQAARHAMHRGRPGRVCGRFPGRTRCCQLPLSSSLGGSTSHLRDSVPRRARTHDVGPVPSWEAR